jgi:hypothetical protein
MVVSWHIVSDRVVVRGGRRLKTPRYAGGDAPEHGHTDVDGDGARRERIDAAEIGRRLGG